MTFAARSISLVTLAVFCASSVLAAGRHPRFYSSHRRPFLLEDNENYRTEAKSTSSHHAILLWPSNTDDCLGYETGLTLEAPLLYLRDGQVYDKRCLKTLAYLVEPEERAVCRKQSGCYRARGYDNDCLIQLSFDQGFNFDFEEAKRLEVEWKTFVCHGKTLDQCGRDHSHWWRSLFPSSRGDCRIRGWVGKERADVSGDDWVSWSMGPDRAAYDNDCLSRFANRLGMEKPGNCTRAGTYVAHNGREVLPTDVPKTLLHATKIRPEVPTSVTDPNYPTATPVATSIPLPKGPSTTDIVPKPLTADIPGIRKEKRNGVPLPPVGALAETADAPAPTSSPLANRAQDPVVDEWSCMWDVNVTLPDSAPRMFDVAFGGAIVGETLPALRGYSRGSRRI